MPKYAKIEFERKFLLPGLPQEIGPDFRIICDLYISRTTLRLRHVTDPGGLHEVFKLTQKKQEHGAMWITSIYLSADEFRLLSATPGLRLTKKRYRFAADSKVGVDVIDLPSGPVVIAEVEGDSEESISGSFSFLSPIREVTDDERYSGFSLARRFSEEEPNRASATVPSGHGSP